ncbi:hypothetical protein HERIO_67 [Hepatospora eriocheir]|uniref:Uncharacterized protein n=1 Tax=Hepatospora eriocheir TaxID=1081669 RepID=A0A1X0QEB3_9MICR|nr:hypothetical protein HERIO_67 [Hepatospora eriocheir]
MLREIFSLFTMLSEIKADNLVKQCCYPAGAGALLSGKNNCLTKPLSSIIGDINNTIQQAFQCTDSPIIPGVTSQPGSYITNGNVPVQPGFAISNSGMRVPEVAPTFSPLNCKASEALEKNAATIQALFQPYINPNAGPVDANCLMKTNMLKSFNDFNNSPLMESINCLDCKKSAYRHPMKIVNIHGVQLPAAYNFKAVKCSPSDPTYVPKRNFCE